MTDIAAAIGLKQFERYPDMLKRRKEIINEYDVAFKPLGIKTLNHYTDKKTPCQDFPDREVGVTKKYQLPYWRFYFQTPHCAPQIQASDSPRKELLPTVF